MFRVDIFQGSTSATKIKTKLPSRTCKHPQTRFLPISQVSDCYAPNLPITTCSPAAPSFCTSALLFSFLTEMYSLSCLSGEFLFTQSYMNLRSVQAFQATMCRSGVLPLTSLCSSDAISSSFPYLKNGHNHS